MMQVAARLVVLRVIASLLAISRSKVFCHSKFGRRHGDEVGMIGHEIIIPDLESAVVSPNGEIGEIELATEIERSRSEENVAALIAAMSHLVGIVSGNRPGHAHHGWVLLPAQWPFKHGRKGEFMMGQTFPYPLIPSPHPKYTGGASCTVTVIL